MGSSSLPSAWPALLRSAAPSSGPNSSAHGARGGLSHLSSRAHAGFPPASLSSSHRHLSDKAASPNAHNDDDNAPPTVETYSARRDERITVATPADGFLFDLRLSARVPYPPAAVFDVLADERAHKIFRGIKETVDRRVLADDHRGKRSLLVAHRAGLRFLGLTAAFETRLRVDEDRRAGTIAFRGADADDASGGGGDAFMKKFEGSWTVAPFDEKALRRAYGGGGGSGGGGHGAPADGGGMAVAGQQLMGSLMDRLGLGGGGVGGSSSGETLVTLEQALAPRLTPPKPVQPLVRALCGRTLQHMVEDLKAELERREKARRR